MAAGPVSGRRCAFLLLEVHRDLVSSYCIVHLGGRGREEWFTRLIKAPHSQRSNMTGVHKLGT